MKSINTKIQEEKGGKIKQTSPSNMKETALWLNKNKDRNAKGSQIEKIQYSRFKLR